jgi:hypothetical protein
VPGRSSTSGGGSCGPEGGLSDADSFLAARFGRLFPLRAFDRAKTKLPARTTGIGEASSFQISNLRVRSNSGSWQSLCVGGSGRCRGGLGLPPVRTDKPSMRTAWGILGGPEPRGLSWHSLPHGARNRALDQFTPTGCRTVQLTFFMLGPFCSVSAQAQSATPKIEAATFVSIEHDQPRMRTILEEGPTPQTQILTSGSSLFSRGPREASTAVGNERSFLMLSAGVYGLAWICTRQSRSEDTSMILSQDHL